jgi:manganese transport protein
MNKQQHGSLGEVHNSVNTQNKVGWRKWLAFLGPAYLVSVGYMDPGNWATDLAGGSQFGYKLIWILLLSNLMALLLQSLSARLGIVRGLDLAQASKNAYSPFVNFCLYILAQIAIIACDLAEIIGMAIGLQLLFDIPLIWGISITILDTLLLLFLLNKGMRHLEGFIVSMIFVIGISFLIEMFIIKPDLMEIASGFKPSNLSGDALYIAIGIIGATVMPHNLYLHSSLVQTRKIMRTPAGIKSSIRMNLFDTTIALNLAFLVNASILILAAAAFYKNGHYQVAEIQDAYYFRPKLYNYRDFSGSDHHGRTSEFADRTLDKTFTYQVIGDYSGIFYHYLFRRPGIGELIGIEPGSIEFTAWICGYSFNTFYFRQENHGRICY